MVRFMATTIRLDHDVKEMRDSSYLSETVVSQMTKYIMVAADLQGGSELDLGHDVVVDSDASGE